MRFLAALGLLSFLAGGTLARAQLQVAAQAEEGRSDFLLYERVDFLVTVTNTSEADLVLDNNEGHPWLSFLISRQNHLPVRSERRAFFKPLTLKVGESKTLMINLTPLFSFRDEGNYSAAAVVSLPGAGDIVSADVPFTVLRGRQIWSAQRPVQGSIRTYSLLRFSPKPDKTELYLRVEDPSENVVYANVGLGKIEAFIDPEVYFDPQGNVHVLHLIAAGHYLYSRADAQGKIVHQGIFKTTNENRPRLARMDDGNVYVAGGVEETPDMVRESLSTGQKNGRAQQQQPSPPGSNRAMPAPASTSIIPPPAAPSPAAGAGSVSY